MMADALSGGFGDVAVDAARAFRSILNALARPGTIETLSGASPPAPLSGAAGALLLTLADGTTPVHLGRSHDLPAVRQWITFHCGAPLVGAEDAAFAIGEWAALGPMSRYLIGTPEYPDRAATLIVEVAGFDRPTARLRGPGLAGEARAALPEVDPFVTNRALFPLGFDCFLTTGQRLVGLPRSTVVEAL
jgi:alpha-D-ribose 1-methylphosphonate 5-triphosphate synthase subunit PhnH